MLAHLRAWSAGSWRLAALFLAVVVPAAATIVWLGAQLLAQDRRLWPWYGSSARHSRRSAAPMPDFPREVRSR